MFLDDVFVFHTNIPILLLVYKVIVCVYTCSQDLNKNGASIHMFHVFISGGKHPPQGWRAFYLEDRPMVLSLTKPGRNVA